jgi:hypothetical protein
MTADETLDLLRASLELHEKNPPYYRRGYDRPYGGEKDCAACGFPVTGAAPDVGPHEDYVSSSFSSNRGKRCPYIHTVRRLKAAVSSLEAEAAELNDIGDIEPRDGPCATFTPQYPGTDYCTCLWTKSAHIVAVTAP